jgi:hypothetical protein
LPAAQTGIAWKPPAFVKAAAVKRDVALQNSYLALALEYDRLADTLEKRRSATTTL